MPAVPLLIRSGVVNDTGRLCPTLQHALEAALSISDVMIEELLERMAPALELDNLSSRPHELEVLDPQAVEALLDLAAPLKRDWQAQLRQVFYQGLAHSAARDASMRFDDLRQLDDRHIDASIEFATAEQALMEATADLLPRLNAQISNLMGWLSVQPDLNPLRPRAYAVALRALLQQHLPDPGQRSHMHVPVAHILGQSLRQVYRELIQWLHAHGVEALQAPGPLGTPDQPPSTAVGRTLLTLNRLRQLLAGDLSASGGGAGFLHTVPSSMTALEDMDLIEPLLQRLRQHPPPQSANPELPVVDGQHLGRLLGQEVVRMMLEHLTHDQRLLPAIRQQLGLLEPALVRLSQAEPRFFSDRAHPARQLLEAISQRSLGYQRHTDEGFAELLDSVTAAVRSIDRVEASEEVFARLLRRLRRRWEAYDALKRQRQAEAARALLHAEQRQQLAERLAGEWRQQLQDVSVPAFVQQFLFGPWAQVVAESRLSPSAAGDGDEALDGVTDDLVWSVQPELIRRDVDRLGRLVPRLVARLRAGLERIGYPHERSGPFFDELVGLHARAFDTPTLGAAVEVEAVSLRDPDDTFWIAGQAARDAGFVDADSAAMGLEPVMVVELGIGSWIELRIKEGWVRAQLTWTSPRGGLYMFISTQGLAHSMTQRTLDRLLQKDALRIIASGGVVDGALDAVAEQALRNSRRPG
jgi:hypothetical protein